MTKTIGNRRQEHLVHMLRARRIALGLRQEDLAKAMGKRQSFVTRLESGERRVDLIEFIELAEVLQFDPEQAFADLVSIVTTN